MSRFDRAAVLRLIEGDEEFLRQASERGMMPGGADERGADEHGDDEAVAELLVARTLVRELEVNWPGVEVILRMRRDMLAMHRQVRELLEMIAARRRVERPL